MKKIIKYVGITAAALLAVAPIAVPGINADTETTVKADTTNTNQSYGNQDDSINFQTDYPGGLVSLSFYVNIDGQETKLTTKLVSTENTGDIDTQPAPIVPGYYADPGTLSIMQTATGYTILHTPKYTKVDADQAAKYATVEKKDEVVHVFNYNGGSSVPLFGFSSDGKMFDVTNRGLSNGTPWYSDQVKTYAGSKYYRVATNEWVSEAYVMNIS